MRERASERARARVRSSARKDRVQAREIQCERECNRKRQAHGHSQQQRSQRNRLARRQQVVLVVVSAICRPGRNDEGACASRYSTVILKGAFSLFHGDITIQSITSMFIFARSGTRCCNNSPVPVMSVILCVCVRAVTANLLYDHV